MLTVYNSWVFPSSIALPQGREVGKQGTQLTQACMPGRTVTRLPGVLDAEA